MGLVDDGERSADLERSAVHFFCGDDKVGDSVGDGVPRITDSNGFDIVGFSPAAFEVTGAIENGFECFAVMS